MAGWQPGVPSGTGRGRGIGFAQYKNMAAYAAVVAEVEVDERCGCCTSGAPRMPGWWSTPTARSTSSKAASSRPSAGRLKEGVRLDTAGISSRDWESYPVLRFSEVPEIDCRADRPATDRPPLGLGEATRRPDRRGDRQCGRAGAWRPNPRPADDARAGHGGVIAELTLAEQQTQMSIALGPIIRVLRIFSIERRRNSSLDSGFKLGSGTPFGPDVLLHISPSPTVEGAAKC